MIMSIVVLYLYSIGSAIKVELQSFPLAYIDTVDNPLCFLQYEDATIPPSQWEVKNGHYILPIVYH